MAMKTPLKRFFRIVASPVRKVSEFFDRRPWAYYAAVALLIAAAALCRGWAAPLSAGPDVAQFWAFARMFQIHGLEFYRYADGVGPIFPEQAWAYVYPPVWLFILRLALFASPGSLATSSLVDVSWRIAMKTPIMAADLVIGGLLLWAVPGSRLKKLVFAAAWLLHPTAWYNSAVFGQFDAIAAALLAASVILMAKGHDRAGFVFAGLAILTKQHTALPVLLMVAAMSRRIPRRRLLANCAIMLGMAALVSAPFMLGGDAIAYLRSVFLPAQRPAYQYPLVYAFGGIGALVTYLHERLGWSIEHLLYWNTPLLAATTLFSAAICYVKRIAVLPAALIGILLFIAVFYRVNYQYLIIYLPLALLALSQARRWIERALLAALIIAPAVWVWLFDVSFWFWNAAPRNEWVTPLLKRFGLTNYPEDWAHVTLAVAIMALALSYVAVMLATRPQAPPALPRSTVAAPTASDLP